MNKDKTVKIDSILKELEIFYEDFLANENIKKANNKKNLPPVEYLIKEKKIPKKMVYPIIDWINKNLNEFSHCLLKKQEDGYDEYSEAYNYLSKAQIKDRVAALDALLNSVQKYTNIKSPKRKKEIDPAKVVKNVKFQEKETLGIGKVLESKSPEKIIGATCCFLYNTKYREFKFIAFTEKGGFVKGTTLQNVDYDKSFSIKIKKPDEFFAMLDTTNPGYYKLHDICSSLTAKKKQFTSNIRLNDSTIIFNTYTQ